MPSRRTVLKSAALLSATPFTNISFAQPTKPSLITKAIHSSGEQVPVIGIGTNRYGVGDDPEAQAPLKETLARFAELGGKVIDTAQSYGSSERVIGNIITELGLVDNFFLSTKCDASGGDATRDQLVDSATELNTEILDLVSVHNMRSWQAQLPILHEAKAAGKIRYVGITTSRDSQHEDFADIMQSQKLDFVQINYSLANREAEKQLLKIAADKGIAVMVNVPFGRGALFDAVEGKELPTWVADFDVASWAQLFLKYIVSHPAVTCAIPGTRRLKYVDDNFSAAMGRLPDAQQRVEIEKFFDSL